MIVATPRSLPNQASTVLGTIFEESYNLQPPSMKSNFKHASFVSAYISCRPPLRLLRLTIQPLRKVG